MSANFGPKTVVQLQSTSKHDRAREDAKNNAWQQQNPAQCTTTVLVKCAVDAHNDVVNVSPHAIDKCNWRMQKHPRSVLPTHPPPPPPNRWRSPTTRRGRRMPA